jgi:hypothetical protein
MARIYNETGMLIQGADGWVPPAVLVTLTVVEIDLGSIPRTSGSFTITIVAGPPVGKPVLIQQAAGPYTGKGDREDEAEMDQVNVTAKVTAATTITAWWVADRPLNGNVKFQYEISQ